MHGIFLVNSAGLVAFAQFGKPVTIERFRYVKDTRLCLVVHSGGCEELFTAEIPQAVGERLGLNVSVLVADIAESGDTVREYEVPVICS